MKKLLAIILSLVMMLTVVPMSVLAADATSGTCGENLTWTFNPDTGELVIDGTGAMYNYDYDNRPWESYEDSIKTVVIGNSVNKIGEGAFRNCTNITSITIPNSVTSIGDSAFYGCTSLTSITIPDSVTNIGNWVFLDCWRLTSITIPNSVTSIGDSTFYGCGRLTSITIPDSVTTIGTDAFYNCWSLTSVTIGNSVTTIGKDAFSNCYSLTSITIPNSVTSIGYRAFYNTGYYDDSANWEDDVLYIGNHLIKANDLGLYTIKEGTKCIAENAFEYCCSLTSITIPNSVTSIGDSAFYGCDSLTSITIPDSVTTIGDYAFHDCDSLANATIGNSVTTIGKDAFSNCYSLTSITIPNSVTSIGDSAFYGCDSLTSITIPDSVTSVGNSVFYNTGYYNDNANWEDNSVLYINNYLIDANTDISGAYSIKEGTKCIADSAFKDCCNLSNITIPDSVTSMGDDAFSGCSSLASITISGSVTSIGYGAFWDCDKLKTVYFRGTATEWTKSAICDAGYPVGEEVVFLDEDDKFIDSGKCGERCIWTLNEKNGELVITGKGRMPGYMVEIGYFANGNISNYSTDAPWFQYRSLIKKIRIEEGVEEISSFYFCTEATSIIIPSSVKNIFGSGNFTGCWNLKEIIVDDANTAYCSDEYGVLYNKEKSEIIDFPAKTEVSHYIVPDGVIRINSSSYNSITNLKSITIPSSVISIKSLNNYTNLENIIVAENNAAYLSDVQGALFNKGKTELLYYPKCNTRKSYTIPDSVTTIGTDAFRDCTSLTSIAIPDSVTSIGNRAFLNCNRLADVYYGGTEESWKNITIGSSNAYLTNATIHYDSADVATKKLDYYIEEDDEHKKLSMQVTLKDEWFAEDSAVYNHDLGGFCSQFTVLGYTKASHPLTDEQKENGTRPAGYITKNQVLKNALTKMGFSDPKVNLSAPREGVNYFVANKKVNVNGEENTLVFIGLIGSYMEQWYSNFDPGTGSTHMGFNGAKNYVSEIVGEYIKNLNLDKSKTKVLITGHSRGAATSNLLAKEFISGLLSVYTTPSNVYTYAFATPNSTSLPERNDEIYKRIFNIVNPEDFVTKVLPTAWKFGNYGTTYTLPSRTNTKPSEYKVHLNKMQTYFKQLKLGEAYAPYRDGEVTVYNLVEKFTSTVKSLNDFNNKEMRFAALTYIKPWDFFQIAICPLVAENIGSSGFVSGITNFALCLADIGAAKTYREFAKFFLENAVLDKVNKMAPDVVHIVLQALSSSTGLSPEALLASSEGYFEDSHCAETYCAYMMTLPKAELVKEKKSLSHTVNCPVDVEVVDKATGDVVGRIVNNVIDEEIASKDNAIVMTVDGDSKSFWLPSDGDYDVRLTGNDEGTMDYTVSEIDSNIGETQRVNFFDVEITDGKEMTGEINSEDFVLEEYSLSFKDESTEDMLPTEIMSGDEIINYNIDVTVEGYGDATESMTVVSGDYVSLVATPVDGNEFLGWYEDDSLVSTDAQYSFVAKEDRSLVAKFSTDKEPDTSNMCGDNLYWSLNEETGELLILGTGKTNNYSATSPVPWTEHKDRIKKIIVSEGVTTIGNDTFIGCKNLEEVSLPSTLTKIGDSAFRDCVALDEIEIPETVKSLGHYAFYGCTGLKDINVGDSVQTIGNYAFRKCSNLKSVTLPEALTRIGKGAFMECPSLFEAEYKGTDEQWTEVTVGENNEALLDALKGIVLGDVNGDGKINSLDALYCLNHATEKTTLEGKTFLAADVDKNGKVNSMDALKILNFAVGKIKEF